jgi:hypothetical protein
MTGKHAIFTYEGLPGLIRSGYDEQPSTHARCVTRPLAERLARARETFGRPLQAVTWYIGT